MYPKQKKDGLETNKINQNIFHQVMPISQFLEAYNQQANLKEKIDLLKQQFPSDPFQQDFNVATTQILGQGGATTSSSRLFNQTASPSPMPFAVSPRLQQAPQQQSLNLTYEQFELCLFVLQDIIKNVINPLEEQNKIARSSSEHKSKQRDFLDQFTQIQWIVLLSIDKLYIELLKSELFDSAHYDQEKIYIMQNGYDILGDIAYYLISKCQIHLHPGFIRQVREKISFCLRELSLHQEAELLDRQKLSTNQYLMSSTLKMESGGTRGTIMQKKLSAVEVNEKNIQMLIKKQIFGDRAEFFSQSQKTSDNNLSFRDDVPNRSQSKMNMHNSSNRLQWWQTHLNEEHLLSDDKIALESLFMSIVRIANSLFNQAQSQLQVQEKMMDEVYMALMKLSASYQTIYLDSYQELSQRFRLNSDVHELSESSALMYDKNKAVAYTDFSLQTLLIRSVQLCLQELLISAQTQIQTQRMQSMNAHNSQNQPQNQNTQQQLQSKQTLLLGRQSKNMTLANRNEFLNQPNNQLMLQDQSWLKKNELKLGQLLEQLSTLQLWQYFLQVDSHNKEPEKQAQFKEKIQSQQMTKQQKEQQMLEYRKNNFLGMQIEQRRVATPTIKRKKTLGMLSIKSNLAMGNNQNKLAGALNSAGLNGPKTFLKKPSDEIQSPSIFVRKLVSSNSQGLLGMGGAHNQDEDFDFEELKTPAEAYKNEPLQIERISNDNINNQLMFTGKITNSPTKPPQNTNNHHHQELADPTTILRREALKKDQMNKSSLAYSSTKLLKSELSRVDWIRRSHLLLELQIDLLQSSFCISNDQIKNQNLFYKMIDLFKITLFFICQFQHQKELFMNVDDLSDITYQDLNPCYLVFTFKILMRLTNQETDQEDFSVMRGGLGGAGAGVINQNSTSVRPNRDLQRLFYDEYVDILRLLAEKGLYETVDTSSALRIYYLIFFEQNICRVASPNKLDLAMPYLISIFKSFYYSEKRIRVIESIESLCMKQSYRQIRAKLLSSEQSQQRVVATQSQAFNQFTKELIPSNNSTQNLIQNQLQTQQQPLTAEQQITLVEINLNKILLQQQSIITICELAQLSQSCFDACWRDIDNTLTHENSVDINQTKLYQYLKLAILLMNKQESISNQDIYKILISSEEKDISVVNEYKPWQLSSKYQNASKLNRKLWDSVIEKIKNYFKQPSNEAYVKNKEKYRGLNRLQNQAVENEYMSSPLIVRNQSELKADTATQNQNQRGALINNSVFQLQKRFLLFSLQNVDIFTSLLKRPVDSGKQDITQVDKTVSGNNTVRKQQYVHYEYYPSNQLQALCIYKEGKKDQNGSLLDLKLRLIFYLFIASDKQLDQNYELFRIHERLLEGVNEFIQEEISVLQKKSEKRKKLELQQQQQLRLQQQEQQLQSNQSQSHFRKHLLIEGLRTDVQALDKEIEQRQTQLRGLILVAIGFLGNYISYKKTKKKTDFESLNLIAHEAFARKILPQMKKLSLLSSQSMHIFPEQLIQIYLYPCKETQYIYSPFEYQRLNEIELLKSKERNYLPKILNFLIYTITDIVTQKEKYDRDRCQNILEHCINTFHAQVVEYSTAQGIHAFRMAKYINIGMIKNLKKIMITLREDFSHKQELIYKTKQIIERAFQTQSQPLVIREFFAFLREIFYYNQDMDEVDNNLAQDVLEILNNLLKNKNENDPSYNSKNYMNYSQQQMMHRSILSTSRVVQDLSTMKQIQPIDYFYFSISTPGLVSQEKIQIPSDSFYIAFMFKIDMCQLQKYPEAVMTLLHFKQLPTFQSNQENLNTPTLSLYVVDNHRYRIFCNQMFDEQFELDDRWHMIVMKFEHRKSKNQHKLTLFFDNMRGASGMIVDKKFSLPKNQQFYLAYGCFIEKLAETNSKPQTLSNPFLGRMTLPFAFSTSMNLDKMSVEYKGMFEQFLQHQIEKKLTIQLSMQELFAYFKKKRDLTPKEQKALFNDQFYSWDDLNELFINLHKIAQDMNLCSAVHQIRPSLTLVGLGGFKLMYPLFEKSLQSNMSDSQKSDIWKHLFRILRTLMNVEPAHIHRLYKNKNLVDILKYCLIRGGLKHILTKDLMSDVLKILYDVKSNNSKNILEEFYQRYLLDILLNDKFCVLEIKESGSNNNEYNRRQGLSPTAEESEYHNHSNHMHDSRVYRVYEEVAETLYKLYMDQSNMTQLSDYFSILDLVNTKACYEQLEILLKKFSSDFDFIKSNCKIAKVMSKILLQNDDSKGFLKVIRSVIKNQAENKLQKNRFQLKINLKIIEGVLTDLRPKVSPQILQAFRDSYDKTPYLKYISLLRESESSMKQQQVNQSQRQYSYLTPNANNKEIKPSIDNYDMDKLNDKIAALSFKIIYTAHFMFNNVDLRTKMPERMMVNPYTNNNDIDQSRRDRHEFMVKDILEQIQSPNENYSQKKHTQIMMNKTLCTMLLSCYERALPMNMKFRYKPDQLIEFSKKQKEFLRLMESPDFDKYLFEKLRDLFPKFDFDTKSLYLNFLKQGFDLQSIGNEYHVYENQPKEKQEKISHLENIMKQESTIKEIIKMTLRTGETQILDFSERIVSQVCRAYLEQNTMHTEIFYSQVQLDILEITDKVFESDLWFTDADGKYLRLIKELMWRFDEHYQSQIRILGDVVRRIQEIIVWRPSMQDNNKVNLNMKIITFIQIVEDILFRQSVEDKEKILRDPQLIQIIGKFINILDGLYILYFEYPYCPIVRQDQSDPKTEDQQKTTSPSQQNSPPPYKLASNKPQSASQQKEVSGGLNSTNYNFNNQNAISGNNNYNNAKSQNQNASSQNAPGYKKVRQTEDQIRLTNKDGSMHTTFVEGGPLRILLSILLQVVRVADQSSEESYVQSIDMLKFILMREESNFLWNLQRQSVSFNNQSSQKSKDKEENRVYEQQVPLLRKFQKDQKAKSQKINQFNASKKSIKTMMREQIQLVTGISNDAYNLGEHQKMQNTMLFVLMTITFEVYDIMRKRQEKINKTHKRLLKLQSDLLARQQIVETNSNTKTSKWHQEDQEYFGILPPTATTPITIVNSQNPQTESNQVNLQSAQHVQAAVVDVKQNFRLQTQTSGQQLSEGYSPITQIQIMPSSNNLSQFITTAVVNQKLSALQLNPFEQFIQYDLLRFTYEIYNCLFSIYSQGFDLSKINELHDVIQTIMCPSIKENLKYHFGLYELDRKERLIKNYVLGRLYTPQSIEKWTDSDVFQVGLKQSWFNMRTTQSRGQSDDMQQKETFTYQSSSNYSEEGSRLDEDTEADQNFLKANLEKSDDLKFEQEEYSSQQMLQNRKVANADAFVDQNAFSPTNPRNYANVEIEDDQDFERQSQIYLDSIMHFISRYYFNIQQHFGSLESTTQRFKGVDEDFLMSFKSQYLDRSHSVELFRAIGKSFSNKMRNSVKQLYKEFLKFPESKERKETLANKKKNEATKNKQRLDEFYQQNKIKTEKMSSQNNISLSPQMQGQNMIPNLSHFQQNNPISTPKLQAQKSFNNPLIQQLEITNLGQSQQLPKFNVKNMDHISGEVKNKADYNQIYEGFANSSQKQQVAGSNQNQQISQFPSNLQQLNKLNYQQINLLHQQSSQFGMTLQSQSSRTKRSPSHDSQLNIYDVVSEDGSSQMQFNVKPQEKIPQVIRLNPNNANKQNTPQLLNGDKLPSKFIISGDHRTLHYYYTKYQYKKIVNRLYQDQSSMWFDHLEQNKKDYADLKEIYDLISQPQKPKEGGTRDSKVQTSKKNQEEEKTTTNPKSSQGVNQANQIAQKQTQNKIKTRQYDHFVRQRRNFDTWGRMMLLKPDRKYKKTKFWMTHMYFVHDFLRSVFAVGFLEDEDFDDFRGGQNSEQQQMTIDQQSLYQNLKKDQIKKDFESYQLQKQNLQDADSSQMNQTLSQYMTDQIDIAVKQPQSVQFQQLREMLLRKLEQNDFLYNLFMNPQQVIPRNNNNQLENQQAFEFHELNKNDPGTSGSNGIGLKAAKALHGEVQEFPVQYNAVEGPYFGVLYLSSEFIMFKSKFDVADPRQYPFSEVLDHQLVKKEKVWHFTEIDQIFKRRFLLVDQACEIFTKEKKSYFFNFFEPEPCNKFFAFIDKLRKYYGSLEPIEDSIKEFKERKFKDDWLSGKISNEHFLLLVNKYSGRSFNDLNQYPIFPWIIKDYETPDYVEFQKRIEKGEALRDLTKHAGVLSEQKKAKAEETYQKEIEDDGFNLYGNQKHHLKFGYSNKMFTLGYLIRLEPFTDSFIQVNQNLDNPDRLVYSIEYNYHGVETDTQNNSELTPEYFYLPEILRNHNLNHFGRNREGMCVNEVVLPAWCENEHDFIRINREVLDSKQVTMHLTYWLDLMFGEKQKRQEFCNIFYQYAYEDFVKIKENRDKMDRAKIDTIREFMQVPKRVFKEPLYTEKNLQKIGTEILGLNYFHTGRDAQTQQIEKVYYNEDLESEHNQHFSTPQMSDRGQKASSKLFNWGRNKTSNRQTNSSEQPQPPLSRREGGVRDMKPQSSQNLEERPKVIVGPSLIRSFMQKKESKEREIQIQKISEAVREIRDNDKQVLHMHFYMSRLFVFVADIFGASQSNTNPQVKVVGRISENFSQEDLKQQVNLGIRVRSIKGRDLETVFQTVYLDKKQDKLPLLYTCMNLDNTIKVFDLNIKKNKPNLVYQEAINNNVVTVIKFSHEGKYFITGDADGIIHFYVQRNNEDMKENQAFNMTRSALMQPSQIELNPNFPYILRYKVQDHMGAILGLDINEALDMYVTASADGNLQVRCLRTSQLWKVIPVDILSKPTIKVQSLKMSLHGYIILIAKYQITKNNSSQTNSNNNPKGMKQGIRIYSLNGDELLNLEKNRPSFRVKYAQLTQKEDQIIVVTNEVPEKNSDRGRVGVISVFRLFNFYYEQKHIELCFYEILAKDSQFKKGGRDQQQQQRGQGIYMPTIKSFALSKDEGKMNIFLSNHQLICFDESKEKIIQHLDDFGLIA